MDEHGHQGIGISLCEAVPYKFGKHMYQGVSSGNCRDTMRGGGGPLEGVKRATDGGPKTAVNRYFCKKYN